MTRPFETNARGGAPPTLDFARHALFLDLDGTLVDIASQPHFVAASERTRETLRAIGAATGGALALVTGREIEDADRILGGAVACIAGLHGLECRISPGQWRTRAAATPELRALIADLLAAAQRGALNAIVEDKGASVALHYRHAPASEAHTIRAAEAAATERGFRTQRGKMVIEILPQGASKGDAVRGLMIDPLFAGRTPVAVGDDITDESAFAAANALGGISVRVGQTQPTEARFNLAGVAQVHDWLERSLVTAAAL